ncbi:VOC family protein [Streptomyces sp. HUAS MG47]|uniref:VOC family protein n=1 Tax=Streptomyces solicamelliae TaxID=3231716 RepID=UPI003877FFCF
MTTLHWKLVIDANDPHAEAEFWAGTLGYLVEDHSALIERLLSVGAVPPEATLTRAGRPAWRELAAVRHPDDPHEPESGTGLGRRILFQGVPEKKSGKNRLHIDVHTAPGTRDTEVARLEGLGATVLREVAEQGSAWTVMADPEGNEFCVH